jgi:hypothetical protein
MVTLLAVAFLAKPALRFELDVPATVRTGEEVTIRFRAINDSDRPVVVVNLEPDARALGIRFRHSVERDGKTVVRDARSNLVVQSMIAEKIGKENFATLAPGEAVTLLEERFTHLFPREPRDKPDYARLKRLPLAPGTYTVRAKYGFHRTFDPKEKPYRSYPFRRTLTPEASRLYHQAWLGDVEVTRRFEVRGMGH